MSTWDRAFHAYGPARSGDALVDVLRDGTLVPGVRVCAALTAPDDDAAAEVLRSAPERPFGDMFPHQLPSLSRAIAEVLR